MNCLLRFSHGLRACVLGVALATSWQVLAQTGAAPADPAAPATTEASDAIMLVATPALTDGLYGATVLVARPIGNGQYLGFILNKPSKVTVAQAFPQHAPSQKVKEPIYVGGPERPNSVFALVNSETSPGNGSMRLAPDLFLVLSGSTVDHVIENDPEHARFLVGAVLWQRGELEREIKRGAWYVDEPETDVMMRKETRGLWRELVERLEGKRKAI
jgi:putative transcriptional regulator